MNPRDTFISREGGYMSFIDQDGNIMGEVAIPSGMVACAPYAALVPDGAVYSLSKGLLVVPSNRGGYGMVSRDPADFESGANPDYRPDDQTRFERNIRAMVTNLQRDNERLQHLARLNLETKAAALPAEHEATAKEIQAEIDSAVIE